MVRYNVESAVLPSREGATIVQWQFRNPSEVLYTLKEGHPIHTERRSACENCIIDDARCIVFSF